jgi:hypothetical protein
MGELTASVTRENSITNGVTVEQRRSLRFGVYVPVIVDWTDESGTQRRGGGFTRDISEKGVFVWCKGDCPSCGAGIHIMLLFPGVEPTSKAWRMESKGAVVRMIDDVSEGRGFAATLNEPQTEVLASSSR